MATLLMRDEWVPSVSMLDHLDSFGARNLVVECFMHVQCEGFARMKATFGLPAGIDRLRESAEGALRIAFDSTGGDFDAPTPQSLERALGSLASASAAWGTPPRVIEHNRVRLLEMLSRVEG